jgi:hypothetical protein
MGPEKKYTARPAYRSNAGTTQNLPPQNPPLLTHLTQNIIKLTRSAIPGNINETLGFLCPILEYPGALDILKAKRYFLAH